jgi:hypothetical protein
VKKICYLYQATAQTSLGFVTNHWKSSVDLEFSGNLAAEWNVYCRALILAGIQLHSKEDSLIWIGGDLSGLITIGNFYNALAKEYWLTPITGWRKQIWSWDIAYKLKLFIWLALENKILTWDNLRKRGWAGPSICFLCFNAEETNTHLFINCSFSQTTWYILSTIYNFNTIWGGRSITQCYETWILVEKAQRTLPALTC